MVPVVGQAACARDPLPTLSHGGYGEMVARGMGRREEEEKRKRGGGALLYLRNTYLPKISSQVPCTFPFKVTVTVTCHTGSSGVSGDNKEHCSSLLTPNLAGSLTIVCCSNRILFH